MNRIILQAEAASILYHFNIKNLDGNGYVLLEG